MQGRCRVGDILTPLALLALYILVMRYILPRAGVQT
jgi:hypothetical protein